MRSTIRLELTLFSSVLVLITVLFLILGASYLNLTQNQRSNQTRLEVAKGAFEKRFYQALTHLDESLKRLLSDDVLASGTVLSYKVGIPNDAFKEALFKFGEALQLEKLGFYPNKDLADTENLQWGYSQALGGVVDFDPVFSNDGMATLWSKNQYDEFVQKRIPSPTFYPNKYIPGEAYTVQRTADNMHLRIQIPYDITNPELNVEHIGQFILEKSIPLDLETLGHELGVEFKIYDHQGLSDIRGTAFPDLNLSQQEGSMEGTLELQDMAGIYYDTFMFPLIFEEETLGYVSINISKQATYQKFKETIILLALLGAGALLVGMILAILIINRLIRPIIQITSLMKEIAAGEGNLTKRLTIASKNEIGEQAKWFNLFISKIQVIIKDVMVDAETLSYATDSLFDNSQKIEKSSNEIAEATTEEAAAITESSSALTEMAAVIQSITEETQMIQTMTLNAEGIAERGNQAVLQTNESIKRIMESSQKIESIIGVITEISNQTNLLALNAAIEAAKAGDAGKGFAVVADEVKRLAERSSSAVIDIQNLIALSTQSINENKTVVGKTQKVLAEIIQEVQSISQQITNLSSGIAQQDQGLQEVAKNVDTLSDLSESNADAVQSLSHNLGNMTQTTDELHLLAEKVMSKVQQFEV